MTVPRLKALLRVWEEDPPIQVAFARFVGIKPKERPRKQSADEAYQELLGLGFGLAPGKAPPKNGGAE